jgi:hypothetical protein
LASARSTNASGRRGVTDELADDALERACRCLAVEALAHLQQRAIDDGGDVVGVGGQRLAKGVEGAIVAAQGRLGKAERVQHERVLRIFLGRRAQRGGSVLGLIEQQLGLPDEVASRCAGTILEQRLRLTRGEIDLAFGEREVDARLPLLGPVAVAERGHRALRGLWRLAELEGELREHLGAHRRRTPVVALRQDLPVEQLGRLVAGEVARLHLLERQLQAGLDAAAQAPLADEQARDQAGRNDHRDDGGERDPAARGAMTRAGQRFHRARQQAGSALLAALARRQWRWLTTLGAPRRWRGRHVGRMAEVGRLATAPAVPWRPIVERGLVRIGRDHPLEWDRSEELERLLAALGVGRARSLRRLGRRVEIDPTAADAPAHLVAGLPVEAVERQRPARVRQIVLRHAILTRERRRRRRVGGREIVARLWHEHDVVRGDRNRGIRALVDRVEALGGSWIGPAVRPDRESGVAAALVGALGQVGVETVERVHLAGDTARRGEPARERDRCTPRRGLVVARGLDRRLVATASLRRAQALARMPARQVIDGGRGRGLEQRARQHGLRARGQARSALARVLVGRRQLARRTPGTGRDGRGDFMRWIGAMRIGR